MDFGIGFQPFFRQNAPGAEPISGGNSEEFLHLQVRFITLREELLLFADAMRRAGSHACNVFRLQRLQAGFASK
ncbi:hypothetical protein [Occallatibacter riparius]|uniref:Uncharacterized protein n=1 Tax=Occallatibacter riparius TaxID=1002689 RepID=A0A9J7BH52_9BACT|nr:hypothetical protein [Occallatibacter riparius]UWZ82063.1 hypothetical protein MOP44_15950 [Occallatibacter riparius]